MRHPDSLACSSKGRSRRSGGRLHAFDESGIAEKDLLPQPPSPKVQARLTGHQLGITVRCTPPVQGAAQAAAQHKSVQAVGIEPGRSRLQTDMRAVARPRPGRQVTNQTEAQRAQFEVAAGVEQMGFAVHQHTFETTMEQRPFAAMAAVVMLGVDTVQMTHQARKIGLAGEQQQLKMIGKQAVGQHLGVKALHGLGKQPEQRAPIGVINTGRNTWVAARAEQVDSAGNFDARRTGHAST